MRFVGGRLPQHSTLWQWRYPALAFASLFAMRTYWQMEPGLVPAAFCWTNLFVILLWLLQRFSLLKTPTGFFFLSGFALNALVTLANGGFMPIAGEGHNGIYEPLTDATKLPWLADVLPLKSSLGDLLVAAGLVVMAWTVVTQRHAPKKTSDSGDLERIASLSPNFQQIQPDQHDSGAKS